MAGSNGFKGYEPTSIDEILLINSVSKDDVIENCMICRNRRRLWQKEFFNKAINMHEVYDSDECRQQCKYCLAIIAKRKAAFKILVAYFEKYSLRFFSIKTLKTFARKYFSAHEIVSNTVRTIVKEMQNAGYFEIDKKARNSTRYKVIKIPESSFYDHAIQRGHGFERGIKPGESFS